MLPVDTLSLSKIGDVWIRLHRPEPGKVKRVTVRHSACKKWYACRTVEADITIVEKRDHPAVGIDMGLSSFATLSNGKKVLNPRFFRSEEKELARVQRRLSKAEKGIVERKNRIKVVRRVQERIANKRCDFVYRLSRSLVDEYGVIAFEDLNVKGMVRNHCLAKSMGDAAWNMLITITKYKAESAGTVVALVNPAYTSKLCSRCGLLVEKKLSDRTHECPGCGLVMDRDEAAAVNILRLGLQSIGQRAVEAHRL